MLRTHWILRPWIWSKCISQAAPKFSNATWRPRYRTGQSKGRSVMNVVASPGLLISTKRSTRSDCASQWEESRFPEKADEARWPVFDRFSFLEQFWTHSKIEQKVQGTLLPLALHSPSPHQRLPHSQHSPPEWDICYNQWIYMDTSLSPKGYSFHQCCTIYGFWPMYKDMYPPLQYHVE